jgi:biopolymer transport protein ExbD
VSHRRRKRALKTEETISPNLIPMIDIMFLLLLFFMLGADMGHRELEEVRLPIAPSVIEEKNVPSDRVVVNVYHAYESEVKCAAYAAGEPCVDESHWRIGIRGQDYTRETIKGAMRAEADLERTDPSNPHVSERRVMIRADQSALYGFVQKVMNACAEAGIYKVEIAAAQKVQ